MYDYDDMILRKKRKMIKINIKLHLLDFIDNYEVRVKARGGDGAQRG